MPQRDGMTSSPSPAGTPREEPVQVIPLQLRPLEGPSQPTEMPEDATPNGAFVTLGQNLQLLKKRVGQNFYLLKI